MQSKLKGFIIIKKGEILNLIDFNDNKSLSQLLVATRASGAPGLCCCSGDGGPLGRATERTRLLLLLLLDPSSGTQPLESYYSILNSGNETDRVSPVFFLLQKLSNYLSVKYRSYIHQQKSKSSNIPTRDFLQHPITSII